MRILRRRSRVNTSLAVVAAVFPRRENRDSVGDAWRRGDGGAGAGGGVGSVGAGGGGGGVSATGAGTTTGRVAFFFLILRHFFTLTVTFLPRLVEGTRRILQNSEAFREHLAASLFHCSRGGGASMLPA